MMMRKFFLFSTAAASVLTACPSWAAQPVQAGLWQYDVQIKSQSGQVEAGLAQAKEKLAAMPTKERKAIEKIMAEKGVSLDGSGTIMKICIKEQDAQRGAVPIQKGNCTHKILSSNAATSKVEFTCQTEPSVQGTGDVTVLSPTSFKATAVAQTQVNGQPERLNLTQDGKWLSADCAGIPAANAP
jgi:Protein of unknown function (DUF3617)